MASIGEIGRDYGYKITRHWKKDVQSWVISGHSREGAIACSYARNNQGSKLKGVVLLAAYGGDKNIFNGDLSKSDYKVMSIYGSLDGIALYNDVIVDSTKMLPPSAEFIEIEGGNHSQFSYAEGIQVSGDKVDGTNHFP